MNPVQCSIFPACQYEVPSPAATYMFFSIMKQGYIIIVTSSRLAESIIINIMYGFWFGGGF